MAEIAHGKLAGFVAKKSPLSLIAYVEAEGDWLHDAMVKEGIIY